MDVVPGTNIILDFEGYEPEKMCELEKLCEDVHYLRPDSTTLWIDNEAPAEERYKLFLRNPGGLYPGIVAVSGDGIHFRNFRFTHPTYDRSTVFYNPFRKKWVYSICEIWHDRSRDYRECDNFFEGASWKEEEVHHWLACDALDKPYPYIRFAPQLYNVDAVGYESIMLGMFEIMYGSENDVCAAAGVPQNHQIATNVQPGRL